MKKLSLIIHKEYLEDTIKELHKVGIIEITNISKSEPSILKEADKSEMDPEVATCTNYELRISRLIDILKKYKKSPKGLKAMLNPPKSEKSTIHERTIDEIFSYSESILHEIEEHILEFENKINTISEKINSIDNKIEQISFLLNFELDLSDIGESSHLFITAGKTSELSQLKKELAPINLTTVYSKQFGTGKKIEWAIIIVSHITEKDKIERIIRDKVTIFDISEIKGSPKEVVSELKKQKTKIIEERKLINKKLQS